MEKSITSAPDGICGGTQPAQRVALGPRQGERVPDAVELPAPATGRERPPHGAEVVEPHPVAEVEEPLRGRRGRLPGEVERGRAPAARGGIEPRHVIGSGPTSSRESTTSTTTASASACSRRT